MTEFKETPGGTVRAKATMSAVVTRAADGSREPVEMEGGGVSYVEVDYAQAVALWGEDVARAKFADRDGTLVDN